MREYVLGALGVAVAYPAIWYQMEPEPVAEVAMAAEPRVAEAERERAARPERLREKAPRQSTARAEPEPIAELMMSMTQPEAVPPGEPRVRAPSTPLSPLPEALPATIDQMSELQRLAHDPVRLAQHVQGLESNAAELAQLRAFAEKFVQLPPERVPQRIMNPEGRAGAPRGSRASGR